MKFSFDLKFFIAGVLIISLLNYSTFLGEQSSKEVSTQTSNTVTAELGDIKNSVEVVGNAELVDEQSLSFNKAGTITKVYFSAGDSVNKGDIIAQLDDSDGYDSIDEAKISLENAKISLNDLYDEVDESKQLQAKNSITTAQNNLDIAQKEFENIKVSQENSLSELLENIETKEKELLSSKKNLELSKEELELAKEQQDDSFSTTITNKEKVISELENGLTSELSSIDKILEQTDYILGVTDENDDKNDEYENYLGAKDTATKVNAEDSFTKSLSLYKEINTRISEYSTRDITELKGILSDLVVLYKQLEITTNLTYKTADSSVESSSLTSSKIDSMKSTMYSYRSTSQGKITSLNSDLTQLSTLTNTELLSLSNSNSIAQKEENIKSTELLIEKQELEIVNSKKNYELTKNEFETSIISKQNNLTNLEKNLELSKISYDELMEGPTDSNITKANNSIKQAQIRLDSAYEALEDYQLEAPFDGVVRKIDYMVGDNISSDTNKSVYIENPNLLEISVYLDQIDIIDAELGQEAEVTFDAYSTIPVKAKISSIDTTPVQSSGVVSYEVKIILDDETFDKKVLSGFTADVEIITQSKIGVVVLKTSAISEKDGKSYVTVIKDGKQTKTEIEIGLNSSGMTEIISGLQEGDNVLIEEFVSTGTKTEKASTSLFGGGTTNTGRGNRQPGGF